MSNVSYELYNLSSILAICKLFVSGSPRIAYSLNLLRIGHISFYVLSSSSSFWFAMVFTMNTFVENCDFS
jgi:hypothetical protein